MGQLPAGVRTGPVRPTLPRANSTRLLPGMSIRVGSATMGQLPAGVRTGPVGPTLPRANSTRLLPGMSIRVGSATMGQLPAGVRTGPVGPTLPRANSTRLLPGMSIRVESATMGRLPAGGETPTVRPTPPKGSSQQLPPKEPTRVGSAPTEPSPAGVEDPVVSFPAAVQQAPWTQGPDPRMCRPKGTPGDTAGFPLPGWAVPATGTVRVAVLFVDFPDASADHSTQHEAALGLQDAKEILKRASYGKLDLEFKVLHRWLRAEHSYRQYGHRRRPVDEVGGEADIVGEARAAS